MMRDMRTQTLSSYGVHIAVEGPEELCLRPFNHHLYWVSNIYKNLLGVQYKYFFQRKNSSMQARKSLLTIGCPIDTMSDLEQTEQCCPPDCCDMRGLLTFQILWELNKEEMNGQQIAEKIAIRRGTKPTPGTIYPALKELKEGGLIEGRKEGRQIIYHLTSEGEIGLAQASRYFLQAFGDIADDVKVKVKVVVVKGNDCDC